MYERARARMRVAGKKGWVESVGLSWSGSAEGRFVSILYSAFMTGGMSVLFGSISVYIYISVIMQPHPRLPPPLFVFAGAPPVRKGTCVPAEVVLLISTPHPPPPRVQNDSI